MFNLANMYFTGVGTVKDIKMAYKLFLKSKMNGIDESKYYIDKISKTLSPEELGSLNNEFSSLIEKKISTKIAGDKPFLHKKLKIYSKTLIQLNQFFSLEMGKNSILFCYIQTMTHYQTTILAQIRTN